MFSLRSIANKSVKGLGYSVILKKLEYFQRLTLQNLLRQIFNIDVSSQMLKVLEMLAYPMAV